MVEFTTKDLAQAAFLWLQDGVEMVNTTCSGRSVFFHFRANNMTEAEQTEILLDYANGNACVEPHTFLDYMSRLRVFLNSRYNDESRREIPKSR